MSKREREVSSENAAHRNAGLKPEWQWTAQLQRQFIRLGNPMAEESCVDTGQHGQSEQVRAAFSTTY
jgi:hypothetical protein